MHIIGNPLINKDIQLIHPRLYHPTLAPVPFSRNTNTARKITTFIRNTQIYSYMKHPTYCNLHKVTHIQ